MNRRPLSVALVSWLLIVAGAVGLAYHASEFTTEHPFDFAWVCLVRLLAIVSGVYMLRGSNWARWLALAWLAYHVIFSGFHSLHELAMHGVLLAVIACFLLRSAATEYFHAGKTEAT